jgi:chromosomal replication initiator protein
MELTASELWTRILESSRTGLPEQSYRTWLSGTEAIALSDGELIIRAPGQFHVEWLEDKYRAMLEDRVARIVGRPLRLTFRSAAGSAPHLPNAELRDPTAPSSAASGTDPGTPPASSARAGSRAGLNPRYTFDRFVVGNNNHLAAAACTAVAEKPARTYNPLFLYGGVGLGKTHLMHAIGNRLVDTHPDLRVTYVSAEQFMNELVMSIQDGKSADFRRRYRQMDLLLVDDIPFLEGKEATQEEFFHTFNALYDAQKQIVLTSDRPPKEIPGLEDRLVSRFEWGLVADLKPPDYETRVAILRKKADDDRLTLDTEVIDYIARSCTASVRELEGAVIKLLAYSSLTNQEITVELARTALTAVVGDGGRDPRSRLTVARIREVVSGKWGVSADALVSKRRTRDVTNARQVAMYLARTLLDLSLVKIGEGFGNRDHSTVIHSLRKVEARLGDDDGFRSRVESAQAELVGQR